MPSWTTPVVLCNDGYLSSAPCTQPSLSVPCACLGPTWTRRRRPQIEPCTGRRRHFPPGEIIFVIQSSRGWANWPLEISAGETRFSRVALRPCWRAAGVEGAVWLFSVQAVLFLETLEVSVLQRPGAVERRHLPGTQA